MRVASSSHSSIIRRICQMLLLTLSIKTNAAAEYHWHCRTRTLEGHADSRRLICVTCPVPLCNLAIASRASSPSRRERLASQASKPHSLSADTSFSTPVPHTHMHKTKNLSTQISLPIRPFYI